MRCSQSTGLARVPEKALRQVANAARNNNLAAVRDMLRRGFPVVLLLGARARVDVASLPTGHDAVDRVLREHFVRG